MSRLGQVEGQNIWFTYFGPAGQLNGAHRTETPQSAGAAMSRHGTVRVH